VTALAPSRCSTCGADLGGRAVCSHCGSLAALELGWARLQMRGRQALNEKILSRFPKRLSPHHLLWACAFMPLFVVPPLISLAYSIRAMRRPGSDQMGVRFDWIAIISLLNVILSCAAWYKLHLSPFEIIAYVKQTISVFFDGLFQLPPAKEPPSRMIPI
jgi:hypothetical protein